MLLSIYAWETCNISHSITIVMSDITVTFWSPVFVNWQQRLTCAELNSNKNQGRDHKGALCLFVRTLRVAELRELEETLSPFAASLSTTSTTISPLIKARW